MTEQGSDQTSVTIDGGKRVQIGPLREGERDDLFAIFAAVVQSREGFPHEPPLTRRQFEQYWVETVTVSVGARSGGRLLGAYYLRPNFPGRGAHIANAGYVVGAESRGSGIGRALVQDSIRRAPLHGFDAIQFNLVFESNPARSLYESLGWQVIGRVPDAVEGEAALVYWRSVGPLR